MTPAALTAAEFDTLKVYLDEHTAGWPEPIRAIHQRVISLYETLAGDKKHAGDILKTLRMAMGVDPTSERGKQLLSKR